MAYVESNGHVRDDVTCPVFLFVTQCVFHATFRIDKITSKYRKTANIIEKTSVYHTVNSYITKQHVDILKRCSK